MRKEGLEPSRTEVHTGLNRVRLPISPSTLDINSIISDFVQKINKKMMQTNSVRTVGKYWSQCQIRFASSREHDKVREFFYLIDSKPCHIGQSRRNGPRGIRTLKNLTLRRRMLYPVELWNQISAFVR